MQNSTSCSMVISVYSLYLEERSGIMLKFASVGKSILIQAVGIQANFIEERDTGVIDKQNSGCFDCIHSFDENDTYCKNCLSKCYLKEKIYHNEKNRYGFGTRLKSNAVKLLLYFHFLRPDENGIIKNVSLKETASYLKCDVRTIYNNMKLLDAYGYIKYTKTYEGTRNILILSYKDAFKKASEGGRGYVVMNKPLLDKLIEIDNIITLRLFIRNLVELDSHNMNDESAPVNMLTKSYSQLKRELPTYCKKNIIDKALSHKDKLFFIKKSESGITFSLNEEYIGKRKRKEHTKYCTYHLNKFIEIFNESVLKNRQKTLTDSDPHYNLLYSVITPRFIKALPDDIYNLAQLAVYYSVEEVEDALINAWEYYQYKDEEIESYGAVVRTFIEKAYGKMAS